VRKLLILVIVLAVLAVVGDRVAEDLAEDRVAGVVQQKEDLSSKPDVEFKGFPFLTQVLANDISQVTMTLPEADAAAGATEGLRVEDVRATFSHVRTSDNFHRATARTMTGSAVIPFDSVSALGPFTASYGGAGDQGVGVITLRPDPDQGLPSGLSFDVGVAVANGALTFLGTDGTTKISPVPRNLRPLISSLVGAPHRFYGLPKTFTIDSLKVTRDGIDVALSGEDVELTR
jgi:hypothetical protein